MSSESTIDRLPISWQYKIKRLRQDCARYRIQLRETKAELARVRAENDALRGVSK